MEAREGDLVSKRLTVTDETIKMVPNSETAGMVMK